MQAEHDPGVFAPWMLMAGRLAQGFSAAALTPATLSLVTSQFPEGPARECAPGSYATMSALGFTAGSIFSGILTELLSWRWVFFVNAPIVGLGLLLLPLVVPADRVHSAPRSLDLPGTIALPGESRRADRTGADHAAASEGHTDS